MNATNLNYRYGLTRREIEVLELVAEGLTNEQIARQLHLSYHTIRAHLYSILGKLGANTRVAAARRAQERGII